MNYSAILVIALPGRFDSVAEALSRIPGIELHASDRASSRLICTIEAPTTDEEVRLFRTAADLDGVHDVSLIEHRPDAD